MKPFLQQVAEHYFTRGIEGKVFIFPNRRSMVFFRKYLSESLRNCKGGTEVMLAPQMFTINDFFCYVTRKSTADRISLMLVLYDCYKPLVASPKSLDDFFSWGQTILSDFDEIDKYYVDPDHLFANVADLREMQDDFAWATKEQREAIEKLASHFSASEWKHRREGDTKSSFLAVWNILAQLYHSFRERLGQEGISYEGMAYRSFAQRLEQEAATDILAEVFRDVDKYVFVGLNALNRCEEMVLGKMRDAGLAEFCWDYCGPMISDPQNDSSHFMAEYVKRYPDAFKVQGGGQPGIEVIAVPSATGQAEMLEALLKKEAAQAEPVDWLDYAVVLPDESMLSGVLDNIPAGVDGVNVTMGYPLGASEIASFVKMLLAAQMHISRTRGNIYFYHRQVNDLLSCGALKSVMAPEDAALAEAIHKAAKPFVPVEDFAASELLAKVFRPVVEDMTVASAAANDGMAEYLLGLVSLVAENPAVGEDDIMLECALRCYTAINRLRSLHLDILPQTFAKLLGQIISGISVPFNGEPLGGLQVMGPLETRALDFGHVYILNSSEGVFPRHNVADSFVPLDVRLGFGLPTYKYQDAVWAYYFYRMISRADKVTMIYDSRTSGLASGEESRYVKQLRYLYRDKCKLVEYAANAPINTEQLPESVSKDDAMVAKILSKPFSASKLQTYLSCPMKFYYKVVEDLYADDEVAETLDSGSLGTVCHDTLYALYSGMDEMKKIVDYDKQDNSRARNKTFAPITRDYLEQWLKPSGKDSPELKARKREAEEILRTKLFSFIKFQLHVAEVKGQSLIDANLAIQYIRKVVQRDMEMIGDGSLRIIDLERPYYKVDICGYEFSGYVDRIDTLDGRTIRIVDYKTGSDSPEALAKDNAASLMANIKSDKAALQFYIYDKMVTQDSKIKADSCVNVMYAMKDIFRNEVKPYALNKQFVQDMDAEVKALIADKILNKDVPFTRCNEFNTCKYCDYAVLCGKKNEE